ncbi:xylulokinase [Tabrizicola sp. M-4]|uniref:xylulokinase n=1 Tax=Tabrizicola sp. M-4 TaxID=3055847 RepID=UPI003DA80F41
MQGHLIGIDVGTTSVKAVMLDAAGRRLADFAAGYPTMRPAPGRAEQDPEDWLRLVRRALERFAAVGGPVAGICVTSQVNTHVFVDGDLGVLHPAIVWQDGRAAAAGAGLEEAISPEEKTAWLGAPIPVDASHALARMGWMQAERPEIWARCAHVLLPRDWIVGRLTGQLACDPMSSVGLVTPGLRYADLLIARLPGAAERLVPLADPLEVVGRIGPGWPLSGTPVVLGMMDAWASLFGLGVARDGEGMYLSGTSEVMGVVSRSASGEPGVITFPEWRRVRFHAGPTQSGGASLDWVARLVGQDVEGALAMAGPVEDRAPLFLPHLAGERAPIWDAASRGGFAGLSAATGPEEMVTAVLEGVAFSARLAFEALERSGGVRVPVIRAGGGGLLSDLWAQMRADAFGRPLLRMAGRDPAAVGAAVMAGVGIGAMPDLASAAVALVQSDRVFEPDPLAVERADRRFALWRGLYESLRPINHALARGSLS